MGANRFYLQNFSLGRFLLPPEEARHALISLRLKVGDEVSVFDGKGNEGRARVSRTLRRQVEVEIDEVAHHDRDCPIALTLAAAVVRAHRQAFLIEKCTELGVAAIWPMITDRSVAGEGAAGLEKWRRRSLEAAKQSGRRWLPRIEPPQSFVSVINARGEFAAACFLDVGPGLTTINDFLSESAGRSPLVACIGPEGGWSEEERDAARQNGCQFVSLARTVLRTETAAAAVCAAVSAMAWSVEHAAVHGERPPDVPRAAKDATIDT